MATDVDDADCTLSYVSRPTSSKTRPKSCYEVLQGNHSWEVGCLGPSHRLSLEVYYTVPSAYEPCGCMGMPGNANDQILACDGTPISRWWQENPPADCTRHQSIANANRPPQNDGRIQNIKGEEGAETQQAINKQSGFTLNRGLLSGEKTAASPDSHLKTDAWQAKQGAAEQKAASESVTPNVSCNRKESDRPSDVSSACCANSSNVIYKTRSPKRALEGNITSDGTSSSYLMCTSQGSDQGSNSSLNSLSNKSDSSSYRINRKQSFTELFNRANKEAADSSRQLKSVNGMPNGKCLRYLGYKYMPRSQSCATLTFNWKPQKSPSSSDSDEKSADKPSKESLSFLIPIDESLKKSASSSSSSGLGSTYHPKPKLTNQLFHRDGTPVVRRRPKSLNGPPILRYTQQPPLQQRTRGRPHSSYVPQRPEDSRNATLDVICSYLKEEVCLEQEIHRPTAESTNSESTCGSQELTDAMKYTREKCKYLFAADGINTMYDCFTMEDCLRSSINMIYGSSCACALINMA